MMMEDKGDSNPYYTGNNNNNNNQNNNNNNNNQNPYYNNYGSDDNRNYNENLYTQNNHESNVGDIHKYDPESQDVTDFTQEMRLGFIRKVYGILTVQLMFTALLSSIGFIESVKFYYARNMWLFWVSFGLSIGIIIPLACFKNIARKVPINYILLLSFTACESIMLSYLFASVNDWKTVLTAACITIAVTASLTIYACTTKTDFTFLLGILFVCVPLLILLGIFSFAFGHFLNTLYCCLGVLVYSIYLIIDTQLIMGNCGVAYQVDDYIMAALNVYLDIIQLFIYILSLLSNRS